VPNRRLCYQLHWTNAMIRSIARFLWHLVGCDKIMNGPAETNDAHLGSICVIQGLTISTTMKLASHLPCHYRYPLDMFAILKTRQGIKTRIVNTISSWIMPERLLSHNAFELRSRDIGKHPAVQYSFVILHLFSNLISFLSRKRNVSTVSLIGPRQRREAVV
jgi:hypothetical protein